MAKEEKINESKPADVKFITSLALAVLGCDDHLSHIQISIVQETETKQFRCYFDVVDPTRVKLAEE